MCPLVFLPFRSSDSSDKGGHGGGGGWGGKRRDDSKPSWKREDRKDHQKGMHTYGVGWGV